MERCTNCGCIVSSYDIRCESCGCSLQHDDSGYSPDFGYFDGASDDYEEDLSSSFGPEGDTYQDEDYGESSPPPRRGTRTNASKLAGFFLIALGVILALSLFTVIVLLIMVAN